MEQTTPANQLSILEWAQYYVKECKLSVIPLKEGSKELIDGLSLQQYQEEKPTGDELLEWFGNGSQNNIGIVTGKISNIIVIKLKNKEESDFTKENNFPLTPQVTTDKESYIYFCYDSDIQEFYEKYGLPDGMELNNNYVMAPPGHQYEWDENASLDVPLAELPVILFEEQRFKEMMKEQVKITFQKIQYHKQLFHDQYNDTFIFYEGEAISLQSKKFKTLIYHRQYEKEGDLLSINKINQEIHILEAKALYRCPQRILHNRVAKMDDSFWYDMGDGSAIKVSKGEWEAVGAPILFRRYTHQQKQVRPEKGGDPWAVFDFISNVPDVPNDQRLLVLVYIISCFIPDIAHPVFYPYGPQGAGKSTLCRIIKSLCDPSEAGLLAAPEGKEDLVQNLAHHYVCIFDNVSRLSEYMSDTIARACTGAGFSKRKRYTDDEDIIYKIKHCVGLNGINQIIHKPDLMERTIALSQDICPTF